MHENSFNEGQFAPFIGVTSTQWYQLCNRIAHSVACMRVTSRRLAVGAPYMHLYELHLKDGSKRQFTHPSPNATQKDIVDSLIAIGENVVAGAILKIIFKGKAK